MDYGFDEIAKRAMSSYVARRTEVETSRLEDATKEWARRREVTLHFIETIRPLLRGLFCRLREEGVRPVKTDFGAKRFLGGGESLYDLSYDRKVPLLRERYGPVSDAVRFISSEGDFYDRITIRAHSGKRERMGNPDNVIERPHTVYQPVSPPPKARIDGYSKVMSWSSKLDSRELAAYRIANLIIETDRIVDLTAPPLMEAVVLDRSDGSLYFGWPKRVESDDYPRPARVGPDFTPPTIEPLDAYVKRIGSLTIEANSWHKSRR